MVEIEQAIQQIYHGAQSLEKARTETLKEKDFDKLNQACINFFDSFKKVMPDIRKLLD